MLKTTLTFLITSAGMTCVRFSAPHDQKGHFHQLTSTWAYYTVILSQGQPDCTWLKHVCSTVPTLNRLPSICVLLWKILWKYVYTFLFYIRCELSADQNIPHTTLSGIAFAKLGMLDEQVLKKKQLSLKHVLLCTHAEVCKWRG